jgi:hypothetical protein
VQDLSSLAEDAMWPTSQAAGNMTSGRDKAMSAPGSPPVDPLPPSAKQGDPKVEFSPGGRREPGDTGKPAPRPGPLPGGSHSWASTPAAGKDQPR